MRECSSCQAVNDNNAQFCLECGQKLAPPRGGVQPEEPQAAGGRKRLHSPILGGYEDVDDNARRPADKQPRQAPKGKPAHLRSPLLGGADDEYEEEFEEPAQKPGKGKPAQKPGKMRSPLLGGSDSGDDYEEDFPLRDRNNDHTPFPHRNRPREADSAPKAPAQQGGGGKAHLRSPLLGGDDDYQEDEYEQPVGRGQQPNPVQPQRPQKLHSPIFDRSSSGGGGYGDYYEDDEQEEIDDPSVLRSPLLAAKARVPMDRGPKQGDTPPNQQPNSRPAPQQPYGQPPVQPAAQPGFPQPPQPGYGAPPQAQPPAVNIQQPGLAPGANPGANLAGPFAQSAPGVPTLPTPGVTPQGPSLPSGFPAQPAAQPSSPFNSPPLNMSSAGFAPTPPSPNALQSQAIPEPAPYEFGTKNASSNPVFLAPPAPLGQPSQPSPPSAPLLPEPQFGKPDLGTASGAAAPSVVSPRKDLSATIQESAIDLSTVDSDAETGFVALAATLAPSKPKLKSSRFSAPEPEPTEEYDDFDAKPMGKKGLPSAGRRFDSASDHSMSAGAAAPGGAAMIVFVTAFFAIIAKCWALVSFLQWWMKQPMPMLLDQIGQLAIFIGLAVWAAKASAQK